MYHNESNRAFGLYGKKNGKDDVVERMLKEQMKIPKKDMEIEAYTKMNVLCPNWRPVDAISYVTDKVTRVAKGKGNQEAEGLERTLVYVRQDSSSIKTREDITLSLWTYCVSNLLCAHMCMVRRM